MGFREDWLEAVERKNSVVCAGLDPAECEMGRGDKGLPPNVNKKEWSLAYLEAIAPYCSAIKPNIQYWKNLSDGMNNLGEISRLARELGLVVIDDSKLADIDETNDAGIYSAKNRGADAVTVAPFAGNLEQTIKQGKSIGVGIISMCLMSNPEYEREKNKLVPINSDDYNPQDIIVVNGVNYVRQYVQLACDAARFCADGIVIGAPSQKNHIRNEEIENVRRYAGENMLVLLPGVGAQGGEAGAIWRHFGTDRVIVNVGRSLMFSEGSDSTPVEQAAAARSYQEMLNNLRTKAA